MFIILLFLISTTANAQLNVIVPDSFTVSVNDSILNFDDVWYDSLRMEASRNTFLFNIVNIFHNRDKNSEVKIRIPQTLGQNQVIRQAILYYCLLDDENERNKQNLLIYPYFKETEEPWNIACDYKEKSFIFNIDKWIKINIPDRPLPEEIFLYNQIVKEDESDFSFVGSLSKELLSEFSFTHDIPLDKVMSVYQKVALWNSSIK